MSGRGRGFARRVTRETLEVFRPVLGEKPDDEAVESKGAVAAEGKEPGSGVEVPYEVEGMFRGEPVVVRIPFKRLSSGGGGKGAIGIGDGAHRKSPLAATGSETAPAGRGDSPGEVVWRKRLSRTDAQRQSGHPTGDLRLVQAKFEVGGSIIDQTRYFRHEVFGGLDWTLESETPRVEIATADFDVSILGKPLGTFPLVVSHKASGEAGQGNYTTGLRWGALVAYLRDEADASDATLELRAPASPGRPFQIDIVRED